ncbi:hypothetical protein [Actinacidiphila bryophytorum]|uniref:hypothetical protein n=1 Tax=Actinacidiphila bryophytorum TaxID=1436133 RepID=UPI002176BD70|nr:hypothetical protein [Actinacidiphila bryophytorum]UWE08371.1 hypothetical protein NYE86_06275 [Actinacidiphila bryophytorum]
MLASTQLPLLAGHAAQAEASALPAPLASTLAADTVFTASSGDKELAHVSLTMQAGQPRRLFGQLTATAGGTTAVQWILQIQCTDQTQQQVGVQSDASKNHTTTGAATISSSLLFTAPAAGTYTCHLVTHTSATDYSLTAKAGSTWLKADSDDGFAQMWHNPDCDSPGKLSSCTYLGGPHPVQSFLLQDDSSAVKPWTAAPNAATADFSAVAGLTSCFHGTASCLSTDWGDSSGSQVTSHLEVVQLTAAGAPCNVTRSTNAASSFSKETHHFTIPYQLDDVPVLTSCGSRDFTVRIFMHLDSGNPVKIDGTDVVLVGGPGWTSVPIAFSDGDGTYSVTNRDLV